VAGSISVAKTDIGGSLTRYSVAWTADATGAVSANSFDIRRGRVWSVKFVQGTPTPTTGYAIKLLDPDSADLLGGAGATVNSAVNSYAAAAVGSFMQFVEGYSAVTPTVSGAGANAQGSLTLVVGP
jgi:hypothetical protein